VEKMHKKELEKEPAGDDIIEPNEDHSRRSSRTRSSQRRSSRSRSRRERPFRADASRSRTTSPLSPSRRRVRVRINDIAERFDFRRVREECAVVLGFQAEGDPTSSGQQCSKINLREAWRWTDKTCPGAPSVATR